MSIEPPKKENDWIVNNRIIFLIILTPVISDDGLYEKVRKVLENNQKYAHALKKRSLTIF